jgi:hypothetical protein
VLGPVLPKFAAINPEDDPANGASGTYFVAGGWYTAGDLVPVPPGSPLGLR